MKFLGRNDQLEGKITGDFLSNLFFLSPDANSKVGDHVTREV